MGGMMYSKFDKYLMDTTQNAYLWLLDRTGIYAGTLMFLLMSLACVLGNSVYLAAAFIVINAVAILPRYIMQDKQQFEIYNAVSIYFEDTWMRHGFNVLLIVSMVCFFNSPKIIFSSLFWYIYSYMLTVKIRKREPTEWFPAPAKLATQDIGQ